MSLFVHRPAPLGSLQQLVLLVTLRLGEDAYGAAIQRELEQLTGRRLSIATVYVTMERLEAQGLARSWLGPSTPERGGKAKRYYAVTTRGTQALRRARTELQRAWAGLDSHPAFGSR
ncbi:MAG TPA: PadR family transcriptional regulator [Gemmatimonadaceae bacterium]|nr:PadR family transcriptional regulator [Gemmatimonadaceae bacterium]